MMTKDYVYNQYKHKFLLELLYLTTMVQTIVVLVILILDIVLLMNVVLEDAGFVLMVLEIMELEIGIRKCSF